MDKQIFIKVTLPGETNGFIDTPEKAKVIIDEMVVNFREHGEPESYEFHVIEMTQAEFDELPEFRGF